MRSKLVITLGMLVCLASCAPKKTSSLQDIGQQIPISKVVIKSHTSRIPPLPPVEVNYEWGSNFSAQLADKNLKLTGAPVSLDYSHPVYIVNDVLAGTKPVFASPKYTEKWPYLYYIDNTSDKALVGYHLDDSRVAFRKKGLAIQSSKSVFAVNRGIYEAFVAVEPNFIKTIASGNGGLQWTQTLDSMPDSIPDDRDSGERLLVVKTNSQKVYGISHEYYYNVKIKWMYDGLKGNEKATLQRKEAGGAATSVTAPVADDRRVFVQSTVGIVAALDINNGKEIWRFKPMSATGEYPLQQMVLVANQLVVNDASGIVYLLNAEDGRVLWKNQLSPTTSFWVTKSVIYAISGQQLMAIDIKNGKILDQLNLEDMLDKGKEWFGPVLVEDYLAIASKDGYLGYVSANFNTAIKLDLNKYAGIKQLAAGPMVYNDNLYLFDGKSVITFKPLTEKR